MVAAILLVLGGFLARARGPDRVVGAALFGAGVAWTVSAGVDWMWEMPAITLWFFAAGGLALAGRVQERYDRPHVAVRLVPIVIIAALLVLPARLYVSDAPLREATGAFAREDCPRTADRARAARDALGLRPEPHRLIGFCDVRTGQPDGAVRAMTEAVRLDPDNWELRYGLALAQASAGRDPRPQARIARRLMPGNTRTLELLRSFDSDRPSVWRAQASQASIPTH